MFQLWKSNVLQEYFLGENRLSVAAMLLSICQQNELTHPEQDAAQWSRNPGETGNAVLSALKLGYRHIDTAQFYRNQADVGLAVRDSGIPREEIFVTSKLFTSCWGYDEATAASKASNEELGLGYIDLYLLHTPGPATTKPGVHSEDLQQQGLVKGVELWRGSSRETLEGVQSETRREPTRTVSVAHAPVTR
jgi:diketogulonate reductase-like aldo/keto reductase